METETPTPAFVTLTQLKRQCNVDYDDDDETLLAMGAVTIRRHRTAGER